MLVVSKPKRILRPREAWERLGVKRDTFYQLVKRRRLHLIPLGKRARGILESDLDDLIDELRASAE